MMAQRERARDQALKIDLCSDLGKPLAEFSGVVVRDWESKGSTAV